MAPQNRQKQAPRAVSSTTWKPGQSGNPGGRPRLIGPIRDLARAHTETAIETLVDIMTRSKSDAARARAAEAILDRGWGRPPAEIQVEVERQKPHVDLSSLSTEEIWALKKLREKLDDSVQASDESGVKGWNGFDAPGFRACAPTNFLTPICCVKAAEPNRVDAFVLSLALVFNDLKDLQWILFQTRTRFTLLNVPKEQVSAINGQLSGLANHILRLALSLSHEFFEALEHNKDVMREPEFQRCIARLSPKVRAGWEALTQMSSDDTAPLRKFAVKVRNNGAFHYYQAGKAMARGYQDHFQPNHQNPRRRDAFVSLGDNMEKTRFFFADAAIANASESFTYEELNEDVKRHLKAISEALRFIIEGYLRSKNGGAELAVWTES